MTITTISGSGISDQTTLLGTQADDTFITESNNLYIDALQGADTISGASGVENLTVKAGEGRDNITIRAEILNGFLDLGPDEDRVEMEDFDGTIYGGGGSDLLITSSARTTTNSLIRGNGGDDMFEFNSAKNSIINGNADDDNISISAKTTASQIYGGRQKDTITISEAADSLIRGDANEDIITIEGNLANTTINGNAGDDTIVISSGTVSMSTVYGGKGIDNIDIGGDSIFVKGGADADDIDITSNNNHTVYGDAGNDLIDSSSNKAVFIDGGNGGDTITITAAAINDAIHTINGAAGNDSISGTSGKELIDGGTKDSGNDTIISNGGDDTIYGRAGNDTIMLNSAGLVHVQAGGGDDLVEVSLASLSFDDIIKGERGHDTLAVVGTSANFNMWETNSAAENSFNSITSFETLAFGTTYSNYTVAGTKEINLNSRAQTAGISTIDASYARGGGDDVLKVNAFQFTSSANLNFIGSDDKDVNVHFTGGTGNDTLTTGKITEDAGDTLTGGLGKDTFNIVSTQEIASITDFGLGGADVLIVSGLANGVSATVTEDYTADDNTANNKSTAAVVLNAADRIDINMISASGTYGFVINGGAAASTLSGSQFNDSISGGAGNDTLIGNRGSDTILGGAGSDTINTGRGNGLVKDAGNGNDLITHDVGSSVTIQHTGADTVTLTATRPGAFVVAFAGGERSVDASSSTASVGLRGTAVTANKVTYTGGSGGDTIHGGNAGDVLSGNDGNDTITGGLAADTINVGNGTNTVVFTGGLTVDAISGFTSDDIGAFDLSDLETADKVVNSVTLDFVTGANTSVLADDTISMQTISGASALAAQTNLQAATNVLHYAVDGGVANAAALELALETGGGIITSNGALAANDAFVVQYKDSNTNTYSYAIAHLQNSVNASTKIAAWEVTDIATTNLSADFASSQFSFIA